MTGTTEPDSTDCVCGCPSDEHCLDWEHCHFDETRSSGTTCFRHGCDCEGYWPIDRNDERPPKPPMATPLPDDP